MVRPVCDRLRVIVALAVFTLCGGLTVRLRGEPIAVRHTEGIVHGFLALRTLDGRTIADGDLIQTARGIRVTARLTFRFKDGSLHDETAVYSQRGQFRLMSDRLVQRGPSFPHPLELSIDVRAGAATVRYLEDGKSKEEVERLDLPADVSNGLILTLLKNLDPHALPTALSFVAATPKPRLVKLTLASLGEERFSTGGQRRSAIHYVIKADIGGLSGLLAPLVGKQPPDSHVWILGGQAPAFVKAEQTLYVGGPVWRIELVSPAWPGPPRQSRH